MKSVADIIIETKHLYKEYGQSKSMTSETDPCFFLHRNFKGEQDLLIIFNTRPCSSNCKFCNLKTVDFKNGATPVQQFAYAVEKMKYSLSVLDRITLSNNSSMLDHMSIQHDDLIEILQAITQIRNIKTVVLETSISFVTRDIINKIKTTLGIVQLNILIGFETLDSDIRNNILGKNLSLCEFEKKLDLLADIGCDITTYILYKPSQYMTEHDAFLEAARTAEYLVAQSWIRDINLTIRLNPMFAAKDTEWADIASKASGYTPPLISEVYRLSTLLDKIVPTYVGLSTEGKDEEWGSYRVNSDFDRDILLDIIHFNSKRFRS